MPHDPFAVQRDRQLPSHESIEHAIAALHGAVNATGWLNESERSRAVHIVTTAHADLRTCRMAEHATESAGSAVRSTMSPTHPTHHPATPATEAATRLTRPPSGGAGYESLSERRTTRPITRYLSPRCAGSVAA
jgi:hypothetical protein